MRLPIWLAIFCYTLHAAAAGAYSVVIKGPFEDTLYDLVEEYNGEIGAVGFSQNFASASTASHTYHSAFDYLAAHAGSHGEQIRLIRLDGEGNLTLDRSFSLSEFNRAVSLIKTPDNGYIVGGYSQDGQLLVARLGAEGNMLQLNRFGTENRDRMQRLVPLRDGGVLAVGTSTTSRHPSDAVFEQGLGKSDIYLTRFAKSGMRLWSKKFGTEADDTGVDAVEATDGSIVLLGLSDDGPQRHILLMRLSENGDTLWLKEYTPKAYASAQDLIGLRNGHFVAALTLSDTKGRQQVRLLTFDLQKNILAERDYPTAKSTLLSRLAEKSDASLIGVGSTTDPKNGNTDAFAMRIAPDGNMMWEKSYGGPQQERFRSLALLREGTIAAVGERFPTMGEAADMWIVKLNGDGSFVLKSPQAASLYESLKQVFAKEIANGSITLSRDLRITLCHPSLLFKAGVYELTPVQQTFLELFSNKLLSALQPYRPGITALRINGHTSSEWRGADFTARYLNNAELSTQRAFSVLSYIFSREMNAPYRPWLAQVLSNDGYAFSKIVKNPDEDRVASRRVMFEISLQ